MDPLLDEQIAYYRARAPEYDEWFLRLGRYDQGASLNSIWRAEIDEIRREVDRFKPRGRVLELAAGTGIWTQHLAPTAGELSVLDASSEALAINRAKVRDERVRYIEADLFSWEPDHTYDVVFFGFWLSHIPSERFDWFWSWASRALAPTGRVFFVDNLAPSTSSTDHQLVDEPTTTRRLNDGQEFRIYKLWYRPPELRQRLEVLGWPADVSSTATYFIYGTASRPPEPSDVHER